MTKHSDIRGALYVLRAAFEGKLPIADNTEELFEESLHLLLDRPTRLVITMAGEVGQEAGE